jgi:hypothetical protein
MNIFARLFFSYKFVLTNEKGHFHFLINSIQQVLWYKFSNCENIFLDSSIISYSECSEE